MMEAATHTIGSISVPPGDKDLRSIILEKVQAALSTREGRTVKALLAGIVRAVNVCVGFLLHVDEQTRKQIKTASAVSPMFW